MREDRFIGQDTVVDKYHAPINENYSMTVRDYVLRPQAYAVLQQLNPITIKLPPVSEARGRFYSIVAENADNDNAITLTDNNDSEAWDRDIVLNEKGRGQLLYSDGMRWMLQPSFGDLEVTSILAAGMVNARDVKLVMTVASSANTIEAFRATLESNVKTGAWAQAIFAKLDYKTNGLAHGAGSVVCAELTMPGSSVVRGTYYVWQSEINCPANCVMNGNPIAVMSVSVWGDNKTEFDPVGYLFDIAGVTSTAGGFFEILAKGNADAFLRLRILGVDYYIPIATDTNWA